MSPKTIPIPGIGSAVPPAKAAQTPVTAAQTPANAAQNPANPAKKSGLAQLGAFSSVEKANAAWASLAARPALGGFTRRITVVESDGKTLFRLRASGGDAAELCRSLKAAGAPCTVIE
jgi:cell division protein FtsN